MNVDWNSQVGGIIIGAVLAGVFSILGTLITLVVQDRRTRKQLEHDLRLRQAQFDHEREQEIRGRRTDALAALQNLLEGQKDALTHLWGIYKTGNTQLRGDLRQKPEFGTLVRKEYRAKLWPVNVPLTRAINEYAKESHMLQKALLEGQVANLEPRFKAASDKLSDALKEIPSLMSAINGIEITSNIGGTNE